MATFGSPLCSCRLARYPTTVSKPGSVFVPASYPLTCQKEFEMELLIGFVTTLFISLLIFRT
jgi:hypothetical protein